MVGHKDRRKTKGRGGACVDTGEGMGGWWGGGGAARFYQDPRNSEALDLLLYL